MRHFAFSAPAEDGFGASDSTVHPSHIVGVGASAGGVEALGQFLEALPEGSSDSFVVLLHRAVSVVDYLPEILQRKTALPVVPGRDGQLVMPGTVYVAPAATWTTIEHGRLRVVQRPRPPGWPRTITLLLESLARDQGPRAVAVILSGLDYDGVAALGLIQELGGHTFAQDPDSAGYPDMPKTAILSGHVDEVLRPADIARRIGELGERKRAD